MFKRETLDFLAENRLWNSKDWFDEHKSEYKKYVLEPILALIEALAPVVKEIDVQLVTEPKKCISTIHHNKMWCLFDRSKRISLEISGFFSS